MGFRIKLGSFSLFHLILVLVLSFFSFHFIIDLCLGKKFQRGRVKSNFSSKINFSFKSIIAEYSSVANWDLKLHYILQVIFSFFIEKGSMTSFSPILLIRIEKGRKKGGLVVHCFGSAFFKKWSAISHQWKYIYFIADATNRRKNHLKQKGRILWCRLMMFMI